MHDDKKPSKWLILSLLFALVLIAIAVFYNLRAQAADERFLPITEVATPSGISVWLVEDHTLPIIAMNFIFLDSGTALDPDNKQGLVRLLSNTMDEGAGDLDSQAFQKALSDHSIALSFGASRDGFTGSLKTLSRHKDLAFDLLQKAMVSPRFDEEPLARMKSSNLARIKSSMSEPDWMAARLINDRAFEGHPYGKNSGGTLSGLASVTAQDLRSFKDDNLTRDRLLITIAGDITPDDIKKAIDHIFAKLPAKAKSAPIADTTVQNAGSLYLYEQPIPQTMFEIVFPGFGRKDPDYYALQVLNYIFGGAGFGSRLMEETREKRGLTYGIYSAATDYRHTNTFSISTSTKNESAGEMLDIIKAEMTALSTNPVSDKDLKDAKSYITGSLPLSLSSTSNIAGIMLNLRVEGLPSNYLDHYADKINAVTAADIQKSAGRILKPEAMTTVLVGKPENIPDSIKVEKLPNVE